MEHFTKYGLGEGDDMIEDVPEPDEVPALFHEDSNSKRAELPKPIAVAKKVCGSVLHVITWARSGTWGC